MLRKNILHLPLGSLHQFVTKITIFHIDESYYIGLLFIKIRLFFEKQTIKHLFIVAKVPESIKKADIYGRFHHSIRYLVFLLILYFLLSGCLLSAQPVHSTQAGQHQDLLHRAEDDQHNVIDDPHEDIVQSVYHKVIELRHRF